MMKLALVSTLMVALSGFSANAQQKTDTAEPVKTREEPKSKQDDTERSADDVKKGDDDKDFKRSKLAVLSDDELNELLDRRMEVNMGMTFGNFLKIFLVRSRLSVGTGIGLITDNEKIIRAELQSAFPESYKPRLRELLDAIALQTFSEWKYDREKQFVQTDTVQDKPIKGVVNIHFQRAERKKPFSVKLAEDWTMEDMGHWVMYAPPDFPVGMDIYEFGRYSTKRDDKQAFFEKIRSEVSLEWARRVSPEASADDLKPGKVGKYETLFYETLLKGNGKKFRWRQWVFMVEDRCFFVVSTIPPNLDDEIFPDVEAMIQSFKMEE